MDSSGRMTRSRARKISSDKNGYLAGLQEDHTMVPDMTPENQSRPPAPPPKRAPRVQHRLRLRDPPTFHGFEKLPPELRTKIWCDALPGPRVVQVKAQIVTSKFSLHQRGVHFKSSTRVPAMLHACPESRRIALQHYQLGMRSHLSGPHIYIDFTQDTVYFGVINMTEGFTLSCLLRDMPQKELSKIRFLGVAQDVWNRMASCNAHVLVDFASLKSVTLVMERPRASGSANAVFIEPEPSDETFCNMTNLEFPELDAGYFWPDEVEEVIFDTLLAAYEDDEDEDEDEENFREMPNIEFMVLDPADNLKAKPKKKTKGKGRAISALK